MAKQSRELSFMHLFSGASHGPANELADKLVELSPGGSPERPVQLASASQVEVEALAGPCPFCGERLRLEGPHEVESHGGERLRVARLVCGACRARLSRYYRLGATLN